jgi:HAD superfamily hydrolase (TIGR01509 family)
MPFIQWKDRYNINYKEIDQQHRGLLEILNRLIAGIEQRSESPEIRGVFHQLCEYALSHFSREERYMRGAGYPELVRHQAEHQAFVQKLLDLNQRYDPADPQLLGETRTFLQDWYVGHILRSDMDYLPALRRFGAEARIRAVIFDFGKVIWDFDHRRFLHAIAPACGKPLPELEALLLSPDAPFRAFEAGALDGAQFLARVGELTGYPFTEAELVPAFTDIFTPIEPVAQLIRRLKPGYRLGLISNTNPWHFQHAIRRAEVFPLFDAVTLSFEAGALKPDPRLFEDALDKLDLLAEECVFIDDIPAFAQAATDHLMHGITFTTPVALMAELRRLGVSF